MRRKVRQAVRVARATLLKNKELFEITQAAITIAAIIVGAVWTYHLFIEGRSGEPHLNMHHSIIARVISPGVVWLHLTVNFENTGESVVSLRNGDVRIQEILPLSSSLQKSIEHSEDLVPKNQTLIPWPLVRRYVPQLDIQIEPKETDYLDFDFLLPASLKTMRIYTYFENDRVTSKARRIGWRLASIYEMETVPSNVTSSVDDGAHALTSSHPTVPSSRPAGRP
jgi:hypothetical protein